MSTRADPPVNFTTAVAGPTAWFTAPTVLTTGTAASSTTTTITVSGTPWTADQFAGKRVRITSGGQIKSTAVISSNTSSVLTFGTIIGLTGTPTFEILENPTGRGERVVLRATSSAFTGTTLTVASGTFTADQYNGHFIRVQSSGSGPAIGEIGRITDTTTGPNVITVSGLTTITANLTFEIVNPGGPCVKVDRMTVSARSTAACTVVVHNTLNPTTIVAKLEVAANTAPSALFDFGPQGRLFFPEDGFSVTATGITGGSVSVTQNAQFADPGSGAW